jgi:hypothetical protein
VLELPCSDDHPLVAAYALRLVVEGHGQWEIACEMHEFARLARACGRAQLAERLCRDALVVECREFGADCPFRIANLEELGSLLIEQGREREAVTLLCAAADSRARVGSSDTTEAALARLDLVAALLGAGDPEAAEAALEPCCTAELGADGSARAAALRAKIAAVRR